MELHLVHQDPRGHIVVVSVFLELGAANSCIAKIWNWMPKTTTEEITPLSMNIANILRLIRTIYVQGFLNHTAVFRGGAVDSAERTRSDLCGSTPTVCGHYRRERSTGAAYP
jgi:hypothetical protein